MTPEQRALLQRVYDSLRHHNEPYFTARDEAEDMGVLYDLGYVDGDHTEPDITEFGVTALEKTS